MGEYKLEIFSRMTLRGKRWFFHYQAPNGEIMFQSQPYKRIENAQMACGTIRRTLPDCRVVVI